MLVALLATGTGLFAQTNADSLRAIWNDASRPDTVRFDALYKLASSMRHTAPPDTMLRNAERLAAFAEKRGLEQRVGRALNMQGNALFSIGDYDGALDRYTRSVEVFQKLGDRRNEGVALNGLSNACSIKGNEAQAIVYYMRSLRIAEDLKDSTLIARVLGNIGVSYYMQQDRENALDYFQRRIAVADAIGDKQCASEAWSNIGIVHIELGDTALALEDYARSMQLAEDVGDDSMVLYTLANIAAVHIGRGDHAKGMELYERSMGLARALGDSAMIGQIFTQMGGSLRDRGELKAALSNATLGLRIARRTGNPSAIRDAAELAYDVYKKRGEHAEALRMYELYFAMRDSVSNDENKQAIMHQKFQYDYDKKEALLTAEQEKKDAVATEALRRKSVERNAFIGGFGLMVLLAGVFFTQRNRISKARKRSDELLLNILPAEVAEELKDTGAAQAKLFDYATILFTDFKGFTEASEKLSPQDLVEELNTCFKAFDHIITARGIEKIKTIGDAYMCAGGLPDPKSSTPAEVLYAALEMQAFMTARKTERDAQGLPAFEMRLGIHTGPVVAGIVGVKKFQYDIWGDTVNTASRMESSGAVGQVNISEATYALVKDVTEVREGMEVRSFMFTPRGKVQAKGKGEMEMYFTDLARSQDGLNP